MVGAGVVGAVSGLGVLLEAGNAGAAGLPPLPILILDPYVLVHLLTLAL
jgi:hypothetical protein